MTPVNAGGISFKKTDHLSLKFFQEAVKDFF